MFNLHRGIVIDANDPNGEFRLKVQVPAITGERSVWAWPFVGGRGTKTPTAGERVWISFEQDDVDRALWMGAMFS